MKIILIDTDNSLQNYLKSFLGIDCDLYLGKNKKNHEIAADIKQVIAGDDIIMINLDGEFENQQRTKHKGIELLYWLRLKHEIGNPVVLTSFRGITQILKENPNQTILFAEGIYFTDILSEFEILSKLKNYKPLTKEAIRKHYKTHVNNALDMAQIRHEEANWFAIKTLWDISELLQGKLLKHQDYPEIVKEHLNNLNNFLASWLHPTSNLTPDWVDSATNGLLERKEEFFNKFNPQNFKVLLIDDLATAGWQELLNKIFKNLSVTVDSIIFSGIKNTTHIGKINDLWKQIAQKLSQENYQAIILDLRLFPEDNTLSDINDMSGIVILKELKKNYGYLPVLVTSASNKIWTYKACVANGAYAYWIKEGIDNNYKATDSLDSYLRLVKIIDAFKGKEYAVLKKMKETLHSLKYTGKNFWWTNFNWKVNTTCINGKKHKIFPYTKAKSLTITLLYQQLVDLYSDFLRKKYILGHTSLGNKFYYSAIFLNVGKIIENFHPGQYIDGIGHHSSNSLMHDRGDAEGLKFYKLRNNLSHKDTKMRLQDFVRALDEFSKYISKSNIVPSQEIKNKNRHHLKNCKDDSKKENGGIKKQPKKEKKKKVIPVDDSKKEKKSIIDKIIIWFKKLIT